MAQRFGPGGLIEQEAYLRSKVTRPIIREAISADSGTRQESAFWMGSLKTRLLLLVAYLISVSVVVAVERSWNASGFRLQDLVELESTDLLVVVLVFAVVGVLFCIFVAGIGVVTAGRKVWNEYVATPGTPPSEQCSCGHQKGQREDGNNIDVNVHPTDTTIAAGGSAMVSPHYNVALMNLTQMQRPFPTCPAPPPPPHMDWQRQQQLYPPFYQDGAAVKVQPAYFTGN